MEEIKGTTLRLYLRRRGLKLKTRERKRHHPRPEGDALSQTMEKFYERNNDMPKRAGSDDSCCRCSVCRLSVLREEHPVNRVLLKRFGC